MIHVLGVVVGIVFNYKVISCDFNIVFHSYPASPTQNFQPRRKGWSFFSSYYSNGVKQFDRS